MAFERDVVERFGDDGRNVLLSYHKGLKQAHLDVIPALKELMVTSRPGDQRFIQHFVTQSQREERNIMCLVAPPDRADHEILKVTPDIAAMIYGAYAAFNAARCEQLRPTAPPEVIDHFIKVTHLLEELAQSARTATALVGLPVALMNLAYDSVLAEVDPPGYERAMSHTSGSTH